jgi:hypothetical protein
MYIAEAVKILPNGWLNLPNQQEPDSCWSHLPASTQDKIHLQRLQHWLYITYVAGQTPPDLGASELENRRVRNLDVDFAKTLQAYNCGSGYWDKDWHVLRRHNDGSLAVQKQDLTVYVLPNHHLPPQQRSAQVGDRVAIRLPSNRIDRDEYVAVGNAGIPQGQCLGIFLHLNATSVLPVMQHLTQWLNQAHLPFTLAVPYDPDWYPRRDAGVLQVRQVDATKVLSGLQQRYSNLAGHLGSETALFTKALAPGLAIAEQPSPPESFSTHRCRLVAEGILAGGNDHAQRQQAIAQQFEQAGIPLETPYLNPGSIDRYAVFASG